MLLTNLLLKLLFIKLAQRRLTIITATLLLLIAAWPAQAAHKQVRVYNVPVTSIPLTQAFLTGTYGCTVVEYNWFGYLGPWATVNPPHNLEGAYRANDTGSYELLYCPLGTKDTLIEKELVAPEQLVTDEKLSTAETLILWILLQMIAVGAMLWTWIIEITSLLVAPLLGLRSFITHPMVAAGWPVLQGVANIGFMIALIFIALATTLRIESMGAKKMLPRLFVAAILINFSLVIAGIIIDASRLLMAVMVRSVTDTDLSGLGASILENSNLIDTVYKAGSISPAGLKLEADSWSALFTAFQASILIVTVALGLIILISGLLVRYIILILLLIVSPLAYLAIAFPNTGSFATKWWSTFIKYVLYGPAALFVLLLMVQLLDSGQNIFNDPVGNDALANILSSIVILVMCIAAVMSGKYFGIYGANATLGFVNKRGRQLAGGATKLGVKAGALGTGYIGRKTGFQPIKKTQAAYKGFITERDKAKKREEATLQKQSRVAKWVEKRYANVGATDKQRKARQAVKQGITAIDSGRGALSAYTPDSQEKITKLQDRYSNFAKIMRTSGSAAEAREAMTKDKKLWDAIKQDDPAITAALTQHFAVKDVLELNPDLSLENIVNAASGLSKEEIGTLLRTGNTQRIELMLSDVNVMKNMADDDKAKALAGDFGEVVQRRVLAHVQELSRRDAAKS